jgi:hypothetical protein
MRDAAAALFADREKQMYDSFRSQASEFFQTVAEDHHHPFWTGRSHGDVPQSPTDAADALRDDDEVLAAFEALKAGASIQLHAESGVQMIDEPAIGDRRIIMQQRLATPALPTGLRFLRGVEVRHLIALAPNYEQVPDLFAAYNERYPAVPLPDFVGALSVLLAKGFLRNATA